MSAEFIQAMEEIEKNKGISKEILLEAIESALVSAYKKNYGTSQNVRVDINKADGNIKVFSRRTVVDEMKHDFLEIGIEEARQIDPNYEIGDIIESEVTPRDFGRVSAQTAKQVVVQRIREAEREIVYDEYINRQSEIVTGVIQRISKGNVYINLGKTEAILTAQELIPTEDYEQNGRIKTYILEVKNTTKGPQIYVSRTHPGLVRRLFELEVPEIHDGIVEIKSIAREGGSRTKIAVSSNDENVDPVGACVGHKGSRVQFIVDELFGEKIDIIQWSEDPKELIASALSPSKVENVFVKKDEKSAMVIVPDYQLSLAIGKEGQNARLAARLTGWRIDIKSHSQYYENQEEQPITLDDIEEFDV